MNENVREGDCRRFRVFPSSLTPIFMPPRSLPETDIKQKLRIPFYVPFST